MLWKALVQGSERSALGRVALAHDLCQPKGTELAAHSTEPTACLHGCELAGVADRDDLRAAPLGGLSRRALGRVAAIPASSRIRTHPRGSSSPSFEVDQQPVERARCDPSLLCELARGATRGRHTEHLEARALIDLTQHAGGVGLAGPGERLDDGHPVPGAHARAHGDRLLLGQGTLGTCDRALGE